jgi:putative addiction module component (TIGR02574 family)
MTREALLTSILSLSPDERLSLLDEVWESLQSDPHAFPLTDRQKEELDRRAAEMEKDPNLGSSWEEVKARVWPKR